MRLVDFFTDIVRTEILLWNALDARLVRETGVTLAQFQALDAVRLIGVGARVQDMSTLLSITVGATSKLVDRLEMAGLVLRAPNPDDRRSSLVVLTPDGRAAQDSAGSAAEGILRDILGEVFSDAALEALSGELSTLRSAVNAGASA